MVVALTSTIVHGKMKMLILGLADVVVLPQEVVPQNVALDLNAIPIPVRARSAKKCPKRMNSPHYRMANRSPRPRENLPQSNLPNPIGEKVKEELE
jgi:hypothetical protein